MAMLLRSFLLGLPVHPDARATAERALKLCEQLGHEVELIPCPVERQVTEDCADAPPGGRLIIGGPKKGWHEVCGLSSWIF